MGLRERLAEGLLEQHPEDAARVLEGLPADEAVALLGRGGAATAAGVLRRLAPPAVAAVLAALPDGRVAALCEPLELDASVRLLRRLDAKRVEAVCAELPARRARALRSLLSFPEHTAGALMDPEVLALPRDLSARDALARVREAADQARYNLYVVDRDQLLVGVLNLRELLIAAPATSLDQMMRTPVVSLPARADRRQIVEHPGWREVHSLPVVDEKGAYLGALRYGTLRRLEAELAGSDVGAGGATAAALGELFATGAAGLLEAVAGVGGAARRDVDGS